MLLLHSRTSVALRLSLVPLLTLLALVATALPALAATVAATVSGTARYADAKPVAQGQVQLRDGTGRPLAWTTTDAEGAFTLQSTVEAGNYVVAVEPGPADIQHVPASSGVAVAQDGSAAPVHVTLPEANVTGTVVDSSAEPVRDSWVEVRAANGQFLPPGGPAAARTNVDGKFRMRLPDGEWTLFARPPHGDTGHVGGTGPVTVTGGATADPVALALQKPNLTGVVRTPEANEAFTGQPCVEVRTLSGASLPDGHSCTGTASYAFKLPPGDYTLTAHPHGDATYVRTTVSVTMTEAARVQDIVLERPNVEGAVHDSTGKPVPHSSIEVRSATGQPINGGPGGAQTGADGTFALRLPAGQWTLYARPAYNDSTHVAGSVTVTVQDGVTQSGVVVSLVKPNVTGTVRTSAGGPTYTGHLCVQAQTSDGGHLSDGFSCGGTGTFSFVLPVGSYRLTALPQGSTQYGATTIPVTVTDGGTVTADIVLKASNVAGKVVDPAGTPVANSYVQVRSATGQHLPGAPSTSTDAQGNFSLVLAPGQYSILAQPTHGDTQHVSGSTPVTIADDGSAPSLLVRLEKPNLAGVVRHPSGAVYGGLACLQVRTLDGAYLPDAGGCSTSGRYAVKLPAGSYQLTVQPQNDVSVVATSIRVDIAEASVVKDVTLRTPNVTGTVLDASGAAVSGSWVEVRSSSGQYLPEMQGTSTDGAGRFALLLPDGSYQLVGRPGYGDSKNVPGKTELVVAPGAPVPAVTIRLGRPNLTGVVRGGGSPVTDMCVEARPASGGWIQDAYSCSNNGTYALQLPAGSYIVTARPHGSSSYVATSITVAVGDEPRTADIALKAPNVTGFVRMPNAQAAPYSNVNVTDENGFHVEGGYSYTGATGAYALLLPPGKYTLTAQPPHGSGAGVAGGSESVTVTAGVPVTKDIALRAPNLTGSVTAGGQAVSNTYVEVFDLTRSTWAQGVHVQNGSFGLHLPDGKYRLTARPPYGSSQYVATDAVVDVPADKTVALELGTPNVLGTVLGSDDKPVRDSFVDAVRVGGPGGHAWSSTSVDGRFALKLSEGTYDLTARPAWNDRASSVPTTLRVVVEADSPLNPTIRLKAPNVTGIVQDPDGQPVAESWIDVRDSSGNHVQGAYALSAADGKVALSLEPGQYTVTARTPWANPQSLTQGEATVTVTDRASFVVRLRAPNVRGIVTSSTGGSAVRNSFVDALDADGVQVAWAVSGQDGSYGLRLEPGTYTITARPAWGGTSGDVATARSLTVPGTGTAQGDIELGAANVRGTVTSPSGAPVAHVHVRVVDATTKQMIPGGEAFAGPNGTFSLGLAAGEYELQVSPPYENPHGYAFTTHPLTVASGQLIERSFAFEAANVSGTVLAGEEAVANAFVDISAGSITKTTTTDAQGRFRFSVDQGTWTLVAHPSYERSASHAASAPTEVTVASGSAAPTTLTLTPKAP